MIKKDPPIFKSFVTVDVKFKCCHTSTFGRRGGELISDKVCANSEEFFLHLLETFVGKVRPSGFETLQQLFSFPSCERQQLKPLL
jgi:hypothetical protein